MSLTSTKESSSTPAGWFIYGNQKGHVEPCGCSPATDFGGVVRLANGLDRVARSLKGTVLLSVGDDYPLAPEYKAQSELIARARAKLGVEAVLFSENEVVWRKTLGGKDSTPVLASNLLSSFDSPFEIKTVVRVGKLAVLGFISPEVTKVLGLGRVSEKILEGWKEALKGAETSLLLFRGTTSELTLIHKSKLFSAIYIHPESESCNALPELGQSNDDGFFPLGTSVSAICVPRKGQGFVRGGAALAATLANQDPILNLTANDTDLDLMKSLPEPKAPSFELVSPVTWLPKTLDGEGPLSAQYEQYQQQLKAEFERDAKLKIESLKTTPFAGAAECKKCHESTFESWRTSAHAQAYSTLEKKNKSQDGTCVGCHVLGFKDAGGFVSREHSPAFANVQCENCHGPALEHTKNPAVRPVKSTNNQCQTCHNSEHSAEFDLETYWPKIKH